MFQKEIDSHFDQVFDAGSSALVAGLNSGNFADITQLSKVASAALGGLQATIIELCISVIAKNKERTAESL